MVLFIIFLGVVAVVIIAMITMYNRLVRLRATADSSWSDIDVQLKKRYNLVPSLVETVKGYAAHEKTVFQNVTEARSKAMQATSPGEQAEAENMLRGALKSLFAVAEAYPDLKASTNFMQLQQQLSELENSIEAARRYYNAVARDLNTMIQSFPSNMIASMFGFSLREYFQIESEEERKPIRPDFSS